MSKPKVSSVMLLQLGDDNTDPGPETFSSPCAIMTKGIAINGQTQEDDLFDCPGNDPDTYEPGVAWTDRAITALAGTLSGSGKLATEDFDTWWNWMSSGARKNVRAYLRSRDGTTLKGYFGMASVCTAFELSQENEKALVEVSVSIASSGEITWTSTVT